MPLKKFNKKITKSLAKKYPSWDVSIALRYINIIKDIKSRFPNGAKILDVGSGEFGIATYIGKGYEITGTDIDFGKKRQAGFKIVKASAEKLPFKDNSFDVVTCIDVMEHLPKKIRKKSTEEMVRVGKSVVYISFPRGRFSIYVDKLISKYYQFTHKKGFAYLEEHQKYGLPETAIILKYIDKSLSKFNKNAQVTTGGNTNSLLWIFLLFLGFSENKYLTNIYHKLLFLLPFLNLIHIPPTYRTVITIDSQTKNE